MGAEKIFKYRGEGLDEPYHQWHRTLDRELYCSDLDKIEWDYAADGPRPVGFNEVTSCYTGVRNEKMLGMTWQRLDPDGDGTSAPSSQLLRWMGETLQVPTFVTVHQPDLSEFAVRSLLKPDRWHFLSEGRYIEFLRGLRERPRG